MTSKGTRHAIVVSALEEDLEDKKEKLESAKRLLAEWDDELKSKSYALESSQQFVSSLTLERNSLAEERDNLVKQRDALSMELDNVRGQLLDDEASSSSQLSSVTAKRESGEQVRAQEEKLMEGGRPRRFPQCGGIIYCHLLSSRIYCQP